MTRHEEFQLEIPAYAASRLGGEELLRLEAHLDGCDTCREMAVICKGIAVALREGGEVLFEPHPDAMALRELAQGKRTSLGERMARHVAACPTCELELQIWKSREGQESWIPRRFFLTARAAAPSVAAAAVLGLLLGAGLTLFLRPPAPLPLQAPALPVESPPSAKAWAGRAPQLVLPRLLRGEETARTLRIRKSDPYLVIAVQAPMPEGVGGEEVLHFEIRGENGEVAWSSELTAATIAGDLEAAEVVTFTLPAAQLRPGRYEFRILPRGASEDKAIYRATLEIVLSD